MCGQEMRKHAMFISHRSWKLSRVMLVTFFNALKMCRKPTIVLRTRDWIYFGKFFSPISKPHFSTNMAVPFISPLHDPAFQAGSFPHEFLVKKKCQKNRRAMMSACRSVLNPSLHEGARFMCPLLSAYGYPACHCLEDAW